MYALEWHLKEFHTLISPRCELRREDASVPAIQQKIYVGKRGVTEVL